MSVLRQLTRKHDAMCRSTPVVYEVTVNAGPREHVRDSYRFHSTDISRAGTFERVGCADHSHTFRYYPDAISSTVRE